MVSMSEKSACECRSYESVIAWERQHVDTRVDWTCWRYARVKAAYSSQPNKQSSARLHREKETSKARENAWRIEYQSYLCIHGGRAETGQEQCVGVKTNQKRVAGGSSKSAR
jgi:hypothetical protein